MRIGMAAGQVFNRGGHRHRVVIGKDTRLSGYMIEQALTAGFLSVGVDVLLLGPLPTPAVGFLTRSMRADVGVDGLGLAQSLRGQRHQAVRPRRLQALRRGRGSRSRRWWRATIDHAPSRRPRRSAAPSGSTTPTAATSRRSRHRPRAASISAGLKIVVDCANGAAYKVAPTVLWELGAEVIPLGVEPDGFNINAELRLDPSRGAAGACRDARRRHRHRARRRRRSGRAGVREGQPDRRRPVDGH